MFRLSSLGLCIFSVLATVPASNASTFPTSSKGIQATIVAVSGIDTDNAIAIGQVQNSNLREYCSRDSGGITTKYGGKLSFDQCVAKFTSEVGGKKFSSSANCYRKTIQTHSGPTYKLVSTDMSYGYPLYVWRDVSSGNILDGSSASGAPVVDLTYEMLCPAFAR